MYDPVMADLNNYLSQIEAGERLEEAASELVDDEYWREDAIEENDLDPKDPNIDDKLMEIAMEKIMERSKDDGDY